MYYLGERCRTIAATVRARSPDVEDTFFPQDWKQMIVVEAVVERLLKVLEREGLAKNSKPIVFRWLLSQKLLEPPTERPTDPILPTTSGGNPGLQHYLKSKNLANGKIDTIEREFANITQTVPKSSFPNYPIIENNISIDVQRRDTIKIVVAAFRESKVAAKAEFYLTEFRFLKLQERYQAVQGSSEGFRLHLAQLLMRYRTIAPLCSGYSGGCPAHLFQTFVHHLGTSWELFASPLNFTLPNYLSAYNDTDGPFGSQGSFFRRFPEIVKSGGSFQLNPPFTEEYLSIATSMVLDALVDVCDSSLTFVYIHPVWPDLYGYRDMQRSPHLVRELSFAPKQHYYESGLQHDPQEQRVVASSAPSTIFLLQNDCARRENPISKEAISAIQAAFARSE